MDIMIMKKYIKNQFNEYDVSTTTKKCFNLVFIVSDVTGCFKKNNRSLVQILCLSCGTKHYLALMLILSREALAMALNISVDNVVE